MTLFLSTIVNKIDSKCRVSVPSSFRNSLQKQSFKGVIAFPSYQNHSIDTKEEFDLISLYFGEAEQLPFDKEGRIIIPKNLIKHAAISNEVLFVGLGPTFQMWNPEAYGNKKIKTIKIATKKKLNPRLKPIPKGV